VSYFKTASVLFQINRQNCLWSFMYKCHQVYY